MEKNCVIVFDQNEHGTYFTGQLITGKVIINVKSGSKKLKGIKLQISGYAQCQWKDHHGRKQPQPYVRKRKKHVYYGREDYIASSMFLVGSEAGNNFTMSAGTHTYAFACPIPINCPSSFEGTYGHIRYLAKVVFVRSGASDRTYTMGFTVLKLLDLNQDSRLLKTPANNEAMENFCFFHTRAVHLNVNILQTGYVPGQFILVSANVNNESSSDCKKLIIYLNLRATYTSDTPGLRTTSEKICLLKQTCGPVPRRTQKNFAESLRVPATPPTCEHLSKVVRVSYEICVVAVMNPLIANPKTIIPITIGNVPLISGDYPAPSADDVPTTSSCAMQLANGGSHNLNSEVIEVAEEMDEDDEAEEGEEEVELPPPTYEEAMFMTTNIADDDVNTVSEAASFTPRYPVYDVDSMLAATAQTPPPNMPQKRRRRRRKIKSPFDDKVPTESPVQI